MRQCVYAQYTRRCNLFQLFQRGLLILLILDRKPPMNSFAIFPLNLEDGSMPLGDSDRLFSQVGLTIFSDEFDQDTVSAKESRYFFLTMVQVRIKHHSMKRPEFLTGSLPYTDADAECVRPILLN